MTKISKRTILIVMASLLALVVCAVPAYAYFTDTASASGEKNIVLKYDGDIDEALSGLDKLITVTNKGESDIMVDVRLVGAYSHNGVTVSVNGNDAWTCPSESIGADSQVWTYVGGNNEGVLKPGESTNDASGNRTLVVDVEAPEDLSEFSNFNIVVVGHYYPVYYDDQGNPHAYKASEIEGEN